METSLPAREINHLQHQPGGDDAQDHARNVVPHPRGVSHLRTFRVETLK